MLIARFGAAMYKDVMPTDDEIEDFVESLPIKHEVSEKECRDYLYTKINPPNPIDKPSTSGIPKPPMKKKQWDTSSETSSARSVSSSASCSRLVFNMVEELAFEDAVSSLPQDENLKRVLVLKALSSNQRCRELGIARGGKFSDTQLRDKFKTYMRQKKKASKKMKPFLNNSYYIVNLIGYLYLMIKVSDIKFARRFNVILTSFSREIKMIYNT